MRSVVRREICRPLRHLRAVSGAAGAIRHAGSCENRTPDETLVSHRRFSPARRTLTRCAGLEANRRPICDRNFSCGKTRFFRGDDVAAPSLENIPYI
jgi:hypothetical protein